MSGAAAAGDELVVERRGHVLVARLKRPDAGDALTPGLIHALGAAIVAGETDPDVRADVRAVVLTGTGDRAFFPARTCGPSPGATSPSTTAPSCRRSAASRGARWRCPWSARPTRRRSPAGSSSARSCSTSPARPERAGRRARAGRAPATLGTTFDAIGTRVVTVVVALVENGFRGH